MTPMAATTPPCVNRRSACGEVPTLSCRSSITKYGFTKGMRDLMRPKMWQLGGPVVFPHLVYPNAVTAAASATIIRLACPSTTLPPGISRIARYLPAGNPGPRQEHIPYVEVPLRDEHGTSWTTCWVRTRAWYEQGDITDRTQEHLYEGDKVIIAYRQMLKQQIDIAAERRSHEHHPGRGRERALDAYLEGWPAATIEVATRAGSATAGT